MKAIAIFGSSRSHGNTRKALDAVLDGRCIEVIDVKEYNISYYDYEHKNSVDDFIKIAEKMIKCDVIIFATPVYWYSMSSYLKVFFDRFTDLIQIRKDIGRSLAGKKCYLVSSGTDPKFPLGFEIPFKNTCNYFDMKFVKSFYFYVQKDGVLPKETKKKAQKFGQEIFKES